MPLAVMLLAGCQPLKPPPASPETYQAGYMDLHGATAQDLILLTGSWLSMEATSDRVTELTHFAYEDSAWTSAEVPSLFTQQGYPDEGMVLYRLKLRVPPQMLPLRGYLRSADNAYRLFASTPNEPPTIVASGGVPALDPAQTLRSRGSTTFSLPSDTLIVLTWQISNHGYLGGGPFFAPVIGHERQLSRYVMGRTARSYLTAGLYLLVAVAFLILWAANRRNIRSLAVGSLALFSTVRVLALSGTLEQFFPGTVDYELRIALELSSTMMLSVCLVLIAWSFFPREFAGIQLGRFRLRPALHFDALDARVSGGLAPRYPHRLRTLNTWVVLMLFIVGVTCALIPLVATPWVSAHVLRAWQYCMVGYLLVSLWLAGLALARRRPFAMSLALGALIFLLAGVHDALVSRALLPNRPYVSSVAFVLFLLIQSFVVARRSVLYSNLARHDAEYLQHEVDKQTQELKAAKRAAEAASEAKNLFLQSVTHELRTPVASVMGFTQILHEELNDKLNATQHEFFLTIQQSMRRLLALISSLLDTTRISTGEVDVRMENVDVYALAQGVINELYPQARDKNLRLALHLDTDSATVLTDPLRLHQVILNLVSNAIKFTAEGFVSVSVSDDYVYGGPALSIRVEDSGPGIAPDFIPVLFDRFSQEARTYDQAQQGTGLGLHISRSLTRLMHGDVRVESTVDVGSTFTVLLPRQAVRPEASEATADEAL
ncbi:MAG: sensor histidine kinase [Bacteroidota bacterium]